MHHLASARQMRSHNRNELRWSHHKYPLSPLKLSVWLCEQLHTGWFLRTAVCSNLRLNSGISPHTSHLHSWIDKWLWANLSQRALMESVHYAYGVDVHGWCLAFRSWFRRTIQSLVISQSFPAVFVLCLALFAPSSHIRSCSADWFYWICVRRCLTGYSAHFFSLPRHLLQVRPHSLTTSVHSEARTHK